MLERAFLFQAGDPTYHLVFLFVPCGFSYPERELPGVSHILSVSQQSSKCPKIMCAFISIAVLGFCILKSLLNHISFSTIVRVLALVFK